MPRYFLSNKFYDEMYSSTGGESCKIAGETHVMHTKQNTPGTINITGVSTAIHRVWTTPIFYPNSTGNTNLTLSISHTNVDAGFEIKAVAFSVNTECDCINQIGPDGAPVDYDPNNQNFDPTGLDFKLVEGQTLDSTNTFTFDDLPVDCCDAVIGVCVEYRWTPGRGSGDITINTDVDDSYVHSSLAHNECKPYSLRNPFQHNFVRQNDRVAEGYLSMVEFSTLGGGRSRILTNNDNINSSTNFMYLATEWIIDPTLSDGIGENTIDYTNLFFLFDSSQVFAKRIIIKNQAGTQTAIYNVTVNPSQVNADTDYFETGVSHVSGSITNPINQSLEIQLIF